MSFDEVMKFYRIVSKMVDLTLRILLIESSISDAEEILSAIKQGGYEVIAERVETRSAMQKALRLRPWDVILCEYSLPRFSAMDALALLEKNSLGIPLVVESGSIGEEAIVALLKAGASDFVLKGEWTRLVPAITGALEDTRWFGKKQGGRETPGIEIQLATILQYASEAIIAANENQEIILFNHAAEKTFGYLAREVLGKPLDILIPDRFAELHREHVQDFAASLVSSRPIEERQGLVARRKDGSEFPVEIGLSKLELDGRPIFTATIVDVSERKRTEEALRQMQERFQVLTENAPDGILLIDRDGHGMYISPTGRKMFGFGRGQDPAINLTELVHPHDLPAVFSAISNLIEDPTQHPTVVHRFRQKEGAWLWVESTFTNLLNVKSIEAIVINFRDITERKKAENELREREHQIRALVTSLDDIVFEIDGQGTYLQAWTTNESLLALPKTQLLGKRTVDVLGEEIGRQIESALQRVLHSGKPETIEYPLEVVTGKRWFMARISPVVGNGGSPTSVAALVRDITDRKKDEVRINEQLERLAALREVDQLISSTFDLGLSLNELLGRAIKLLAVDAVDVLLLDSVRNKFEFRAGLGFRTHVIQPASVKLGHSLAGKVAMDRRVVHIQNLALDLKDSSLSDKLKEEGFVGYSGAPMIVKGKVIGVLEAFDRSVMARDQDWLNFFGLLAGQAAIMIEDARLFNELQVTNSELIMAYDETIEGWSHAMDLRDRETEGHSQRVTEWTLKLASRLGFGDEDLIHIRRGALLHDIGKIGVPDMILLKPGPLTEEELVTIRKHPQFAFDMLSPITYLRKAIDIPFCHHEKFDGTGYPRGLKDGEIPLAARIFAVVDVWDALTSDRPYRTAWPQEKALDYIREQAGKRFDPKVVEFFLKELPYVR
jgi:PAS domain S-box-containing protein